MTTKIAAKFNLGDRVIHKNLGVGTLIAPTCYSDVVVVQFDKELEVFNTDTLEVSIDCLKLEG